MGVTGHQPGIWKQQNKEHKTGRHRSKGQIQVQLKGRVGIKAISKKKKKELEKVDRRHRQQQIRSQKREDVINRKRSIGTGHNPPHLVAIVPLHCHADVLSLSETIKESVLSDGNNLSTTPLSSAGFTFNLPRLKHRYQIIQPSSSSLIDILNCTRVADTVLFVVSCDNNPIDEQGYKILSCLLAQGLPSMMFCLQGMNQIAIKMRNSLKKEISKHLEQYVFGIKLHVCDTDQEVINLLRLVGDLKRRNIGLRDNRPYLLIERLEHICEGQDDSGILKVSGHIRGAKMDVNKLVHLVGWGDYQIKQIDEVTEHCPWDLKRKNNNHKVTEMGNNKVESKLFDPWEATGRSVSSDPSLIQDLTQEAEVDPMEGEQTWPTEEELADAEMEDSDNDNSTVNPTVRIKKKIVKKVEEGTSEYQAAWILDSEEDWESEEEEEEMGVELAPRADTESQTDGDVSSMLDETEDEGSQYDMDGGEDEEDLKRFREERSNEMFPDEIDTPDNIPARTRFQRYRGLKSFRTSPWDHDENLPPDYARIFQFRSFDRAKKRIKTLDVDEENCVQAGTYVTIHLMNVPKSFVENRVQESTMTLFGLFQHEQKMSVLHFALKQFGEHTIKSKDELLFHVGFRQFRAKPLFSQHTLGSKHKMERFFPKDEVVVATVYAPITFPPANVIAFNEINKDEIVPVATGTLYKVDPNRVIVKRIIISGHPFRINKRAATIRYMFFNREDVLWFKPVELMTKWGRRGHIKEPLGTHGHMKCSFDSQLTSEDTVLMPLYKRVFPKWAYQQVTPLKHDNSLEDTEMFDEEFFKG